LITQDIVLTRVNRISPYNILTELEDIFENML